jgi:putative FmdB family regulatory protein
MPTYEYRCNACGREFEYQQRMSDPDHTTCEACHEDKLEKLISRTAFQLKGGGWYKDLYSSTPAEASKGAADKSTPPTSTDKPAAKTETAATPATPAPSPSTGGSPNSSGSGSGSGSTGSGGSGSAAASRQS